MQNRIDIYLHVCLPLAHVHSTSFHLSKQRGTGDLRLCARSRRASVARCGSWSHNFSACWARRAGKPIATRSSMARQRGLRSQSSGRFQVGSIQVIIRVLDGFGGSR